MRIERWRQRVDASKRAMEMPEVTMSLDEFARWLVVAEAVKAHRAHTTPTAELDETLYVALDALELEIDK